MALGDNYVTSAELKARLGITDAVDDTRIAGACSAASEEVEKICNRQFNDAGSAVERKYHAYRDIVFVDDFHTSTGLVVKSVEVDSVGTETEETLTSTTYRVFPFEANRLGQIGFPHWAIKNLSATAFPTFEENGYLKVTARWGWAAVPDSVKEATYILAEEYFKMKEAPFGVVNWGEFGPMRVQDNRRVLSLLRNYRRGTPRQN